MMQDWKTKITHDYFYHIVLGSLLKGGVILLFVAGQVLQTPFSFLSTPRNLPRPTGQLSLSFQQEEVSQNVQSLALKGQWWSKYQDGMDFLANHDSTKYYYVRGVSSLEAFVGSRGRKITTGLFAYDGYEKDIPVFGLNQRGKPGIDRARLMEVLKTASSYANKGETVYSKASADPANLTAVSGWLLVFEFSESFPQWEKYGYVPADACPEKPGVPTPWSNVSVLPKDADQHLIGIESFRPWVIIDAVLFRLRRSFSPYVERSMEEEWDMIEQELLMDSQL